MTQPGVTTGRASRTPRPGLLQQVGGRLRPHGRYQRPIAGYADAMTQPQEAVLIGGPRDGEPFHSAGAALVELEVDDYVHRYIRTTATRETDGQTRLVYNYDGMVRPAMASGEPAHDTHQERDEQQSSEHGEGLEFTGPGDGAKRIGQAPTATDVNDPERSSRNTAAGSGSEPGTGPVQPAADAGADPSASIEPRNQAAL
jgi:hypothetical protein